MKTYLIVLITLLSFNLFATIDREKTSDKAILALTIYREARGESFYGKKAVATVIYNRCMKKYKTISGTNIRKVCLRPKQFSCWNKDYRSKDDVHSQMFKQCMKIAEEVLNGKFKPLDNWTNYFNPKKKEQFYNIARTGVLENIANIGNHRFGFLEFF